MQGHTIYFDNRPKIIATATVAGPKETEGIVGKYVDLPLNNDMFNEETYEKAERKCSPMPSKRAYRTPISPRKKSIF